MTLAGCYLPRANERPIKTPPPARSLRSLRLLAVVGLLAALAGYVRVNVHGNPGGLVRAHG